MKKVVKKMVRALALLCSVALLLEAGPVISLAEAAMEEAALSVSAGENEFFETEGGSRLSYVIGAAASRMPARGSCVSRTRVGRPVSGRSRTRSGRRPG